jgi:hypothetical protein
MEEIKIILTFLAALGGYGVCRWFFKEGIEKVKNEQMREEFKDIEETNKRREVRDNTDVSDMRDWLRNYASRKKQ